MAFEAVDSDGVPVYHTNVIACIGTEVALVALDMIHERVTREACRQLLYTSEPVTTVAAGLGFEDPAYFCRFIKRRTGLSPSLYRHSQGE